MSATAHTVETEQVLDPHDVTKLAALAYASARYGDQSRNQLLRGLHSDLARQVARALLSDQPATDEHVRAIAEKIRHWARKSEPAAGRR